MSKAEQRAKVVRYWWAKAKDSLASARREFEAGAYSFAINRLYYALFYAVSAALLERGLSFRKHSGVRAAFHREFIKPGWVDVKWGKFYDQLFEDRQEGDYVALITFDQEYVGFRLDQCARFLTEFRNFVNVETMDDSENRE